MSERTLERTLMETAPPAPIQVNHRLVLLPFELRITECSDTGEYLVVRARVRSIASGRAIEVRNRVLIRPDVKGEERDDIILRALMELLKHEVLETLRRIDGSPIHEPHPGDHL